MAVAVSAEVRDVGPDGEAGGSGPRVLPNIEGDLTHLTEHVRAVARDHMHDLMDVPQAIRQRPRPIVRIVLANHVAQAGLGEGDDVDLVRFHEAGVLVPQGSAGK